MPVAAFRPWRAIVPAVLLALLVAAGCSKKQTSPALNCDSGGVDLIAFASDRGHHGQFDIYLYDIDGVGYRALINLNSTAVSDSSPGLSPDNQIVAFVTARGATGSDILLYARGSCGFIDAPQVNSAGDETEPTFSGDISRLLFVRDTLGSRRIRSIDATGSALALVPMPGLDTMQAGVAFDDWSPAPDRTGKNVVFVSNRNGSAHLYLYMRDSSRVTPLTFTRAADGIEIDPAVTPDGHFLCFASNRSGGQGGFDLYLYDLPQQKLLTGSLAGVNTAGDEEHPSLNTTGTVIAYQGRSAPADPWRVHYFFVGTSNISTIGRMDTTASDIQPSIVFP